MFRSAWKWAKCGFKRVFSHYVDTEHTNRHPRCRYTDLNFIMRNILARGVAFITRGGGNSSFMRVTIFSELFVTFNLVLKAVKQLRSYLNLKRLPAWNAQKIIYMINLMKDCVVLLNIVFIDNYRDSVAMYYSLFNLIKSWVKIFHPSGTLYMLLSKVDQK